MASINITDVEKLPDASCFIAKDTSEIPAFKRANVSMLPTSNGYQLNITTHEAITELVVNLQVTYYCDPNLMREYVLLLDPAFIANNNDIAKNATHIPLPVANANSAQHDVISPNEGAVTTQSRTHKTSKKGLADTSVRKKSKSKRSSESVVDQKLMEAYVGKYITESSATNNNTKNHDTLNQASNKASPSAYLTISNGNLDMPLNSMLSSKLSLRLEREIDFARPANTSPQTTTDVMDEVTVMTNRLAHLEKTINSLQSRNTQLLVEVEKTKKENQALSSQWKLWLSLMLLALGALVAILWFARIKKTHQHDTVSSLFTHEKTTETANTALLPEEDEYVIANGVEAADLEKAVVIPSASLSPAINLTANLQKTAPLPSTPPQPKENVMDHAEVFIAHGRSALAVQLLQNHLADYPAESPEIWLMLLSLLEKDGKEYEYNQAVVECNRFFNIKLPSFAEASTQDPSSIEEYPRILTHLEGVWGTQFAVGFLDNLIYNQQAQPRGGFARNVFDELYFLRTIANILYPQNNQEQSPFFVQPEMKSYWVGEEIRLHSELDSLAPHNPLLDDANLEEDTALKADEIYFSHLDDEEHRLVSSDLTWPHDEQNASKQANVIDWELPVTAKEEKQK